MKVVTDASGNVISSSTDKPFGEDVAGVGFGPKEEFRFTGKGKDESVGLFYFNARWYDPELGRFIQEDPAQDGDNYYVYCENNPLKYTDSTGKYTDREYNDAYNYFSTHGWYGYGKIPLSTAADAYRRSKNAVVLPRPNNKWVIKEFDDSIKDLDKETYELAFTIASLGETAALKELLKFGIKGAIKEGFALKEAITKLLTRKLPTDKLIANPLDDFTILGHSNTALSKHIKYIIKYGKIEGRILVKKIGDKFMIINGHHRWLAAIKTGLKKVAVKVVD